MTRVQEIEHLIAHSFILGVIIDSEKKKNKTIRNLVDSWKRKTLGQMLRVIEENWDIEPMIHRSLRLFLDMRNKLVHGLTMSEQYDINTEWGQDEMIKFLLLFEVVSRPLREAFRAGFYASIELANTHQLKDQPEKQYPLTSRQKKKIGLFAAFFSPKLGEEAVSKT
jgi:hypothetical protein